MTETSKVIEREVQRHGGSLVFNIGKEDCKIKKIEEKDIVEVEIIKVTDPKGKVKWRKD